MPKQSRGFWVCSLCSLAFDQFDEASYHEAEDCPYRFPLHQPIDLPSWQHHQIPHTGSFAVMPPLSNDPQSNLSHHHIDSSISTFPHDRKTELRRFLLLAPHEPINLIESDILACRNIEVFETNEHPKSGPYSGQVGLRCANCSNPESDIFPQSLRHIGDCVRRLADEHLIRCIACHDSVRDILKRNMKKRKQIEREGGSLRIEQDGTKQVLSEFCRARCRHAGVVDRRPQNTGICFEDRKSRQKYSQVQTSQVKDTSSKVSRQTPPVSDDTYRSALLYPERSPSTIPYTASPSFDPRMQYSNISDEHSRHGLMVPYHPNFDPTNAATEVRPIPPPPYTTYIPTYNIPPDFPFLQEAGGEWICKFCSHIHPQLRDPKYYWMVPDRSPPPSEFVDYHLSVCHSFHESNYHSFGYQGASTDVSFSGDQSRTSVPQYNQNTSWISSTEDVQQSFTLGVDHDYLGQQYPNMSGENSAYEAIPYGPLDSSTTQGFSTESYHAQLAPASSLHESHSPSNNDAEYARAIEYLTATDFELQSKDDESKAESEMLVLGEDRLLLTDYFYFIMKQLRPVRFSEADRRTRGGKRENIAVGYGGLQCVHCSEQQSTRKFYWSNVDRLANSFAEIPSHVLKCRRCPQQTKDALRQLKQRHPEQMARLPRGSQKVFFRRMWRRLHDEDPPTIEGTESPTSLDTQQSLVPPSISSMPRPTPVQTSKLLIENSPAGTSGSEESIFLLQRSTEESAKALADSAMQNGPPSPSSRVLLALPDDQKWLSDTDCFIRRQLEVFCATLEEVEHARLDRKYPVLEGQVGIRCIHCAMSKAGARAQAVAYPFNISGIYEAAREFQRLHLETCENLPPVAKAKLIQCKGSSSLSSVLRKYYVISANALGLFDTRDGIRAGGESIPIGSQAAFAFSDESSQRFSDDEKIKPDQSWSTDDYIQDRPDSRKRGSAKDDYDENQDVKRRTLR